MDNQISTPQPEEKPNKNITDVFRDIDEKRIQSDTKDIEDETGNILQLRRTVVTTSTVAPAVIRSTLANTYSNSGGNGGTLDDIQTLGVDSVVRRRHRRRRQRR